MKMLSLGNDLYANIDQLILAIPYDYPKLHKHLISAEANGKIYDMSGDKTPRSAIILSDGTIIITTLTIGTAMSRINALASDVPPLPIPQRRKRK